MTIAALAIASTACGSPEPSVTDSTEATAAIEAALSGSFRTSTSIDVGYERLDVVGALLANPAFLREIASGDSETAAEDTAAQLEEFANAVEGQALVVERGRDRSSRWALTTDGEPWVDVRAKLDQTSALLELQDDEPWELLVQGSVSFDRLLEIVDSEPELTSDDVESARQTAVEGISSTFEPEVGEPLVALVEGFFDGRLVQVGGDITPDLLGIASWQAARSELERPLATPEDPDPLEQFGDSLDPSWGIGLDELIDVTDLRTEGERTLGDVDLLVRGGAEAFLEAAEANAEASGLGLGQAPFGGEELFGEGELFADVEQELDDLPERLSGVGTVSFDAEGQLQELQLDVLALVGEFALVVDDLADDLDTDPEAFASFVDDLDGSGIFVTTTVSDVGAVESVLGEPDATLSPEQIRTAFEGLQTSSFGSELPLTGPSQGAGNPLATTAVLDLPVGACTDVPLASGEEPSEVPCEQPHAGEVYVTGTVEAPYPGETEVMAQLATTCFEEFEQYVGTAYDFSELYYEHSYPTAEQFEAGQTSTACVIVLPNGQLEGSVAGSGR